MTDYFQPVAACNVINDCRQCPFMSMEDRKAFAPSCSSLYTFSTLEYCGMVEFFIDNTGRHNDPIEGAEQVRFLGRTFNILSPTKEVKTNFRFQLPYLEEVEGEPIYRKQGSLNDIHIWKTSDGRFILEN